MEKTEVNSTIEQIEKSVNKSMDESEGLFIIVFSTVVIIVLFKRIINFGNSKINEKTMVSGGNKRLSLKKNNENVVPKSCRLCETMYEAAFSSSSIADDSKRSSFQKFNNHNHIQYFISFCEDFGIDYIKSFIFISILRYTPISYVIVNRKELEYYKKKVIDEEQKVESLKNKLSFVNSKCQMIYEQMEMEKSSYEVHKTCFRNFKDKFENMISELEETIKDLEDQLEESKKENGREEEDDDIQLSPPNNKVFKRQEEQRQNEEEAEKLLMDLDKKGIDDIIFKAQSGKYSIREAAINLLSQMLNGNLDVVQVSIELDQFVKQCKAEREDVLYAIIEVICNLVERRKQGKANICALSIIQKYVSLFREYLCNSKENEIHFIDCIYKHCQIIGIVNPLFINIINKFYKLNILNEEVILSWLNTQNKENIEGILGKETLENFVEYLNIELLKKKVFVKKECDIEIGCNDSGYCSEIDDCNNEGASTNSLLLACNATMNNSNNNEKGHRSYGSWEMIKSRDVPCRCSNCNGKLNELIGEKGHGHDHVHFEEPNISLNQSLIQDLDEETVVIDNEDVNDDDDYNNDNNINTTIRASSPCVKHCDNHCDCCLLDIVEEEEEDGEGEECDSSFVIQDLNGNPLFEKSNELLNGNDSYYDKEGDQSYASSISINLVDNQDIQFNEEKNDTFQILNCYSNNGNESFDVSDHRSCCSDEDNETIVEQEEIIEKEVEYCIINNNSDKENKINEVVYEEEDRVDAFAHEEIVNYSNEVKDDCNDNDDEKYEEDEGIDIIFEDDCCNQENSDIEIYFEKESDDNESSEEEESEEESEESSEESSEEESEEDEDIVYSSKLFQCKRCNSDNEIVINEALRCQKYKGDKYVVNDDDEILRCKGENNDNEILDNEPIRCRRCNNDNEFSSLISHQMSNGGEGKRMYSLNTNSDHSESECESDQSYEVEIIFEDNSDAKTEIYSDESEDEEKTYDSDIENGSDTEFDDDDKIERIKSSPLILHENNKDEDDVDDEDDEDDVDDIDNIDCKTTSIEENHFSYTSSDSAIAMDSNSDQENDYPKSSDMNRSNDHDEIDDMNQNSSDSTIEISDDQEGELQNCNCKKVGIEMKLISMEEAAAEADEENNDNLYLNFEKIKEDGQRKYRIKNLKKKMYNKNRDSGHKEFLKFYVVKSETNNHEYDEDYNFQNCDEKHSKDNIAYLSSSDKKYYHPKYNKKSFKNKKGSKKSLKKHSIKDKNFLNKSSLRN